MMYTKKIFWYNKESNGYIALISVLVLSAIGISITVSLIMLGLGSSRTGFSLEQSSQAKALANTCVEEALQLIRDSSFSGTGNMNLLSGNCTYVVLSQGGQRTIDASGVVGDNLRKVKVIVSKINPSIEILSWQEIADF